MLKIAATSAARHYLLLGITQGVFEWFPVSSEGVVALLSNFLKIGSHPVDVALFLHWGTLFAVLIYFRKQWLEVLSLKRPKLLKFLGISTFFSLMVGFPLYNLVREIAVGNALLLLTGGALLVTAFFNKQKSPQGLGQTKLAVVAGLLQGLAVIPGLSRSGSTIFALSLGQKEPDQVLTWSYMMSVPVVAASGLLLTLREPGLLVEGWPGLLISFGVGWGALSLLFKTVRNLDFFKFALIFSLICFVGFAINLVS